MMNDRLDEQLARIERILLEVLERLRLLEEAIARESVEAHIAIEVYKALQTPIHSALAIASRTIRALERLNPHTREDIIYKAIIEVLAAGGPQSLRGLEQGVRRLVGRASRNTIRKKLRDLEEAGIVRVERRGRRMVISLVEDERERGPKDGSGGSTLPR